MTEIEKKKQARHNITIKKRHEPTTNTNVNDDKVQNMLKLINNSNGYDNDSSDDLADFNPPPRAEVSTKTSAPLETPMPNGKELTVDFEKPISVMQKEHELPRDGSTEVKPRKYPAPMDSYEGFNAQPKTYASDYYKQYVPYFNQSGSSDPVNNVNKSQLLEKLNYMIHLLEEQRDEKTGHVMEEIILYSFLGVFIIFIVDSFARVGKYTR